MKQPEQSHACERFHGRSGGIDQEMEAVPTSPLFEGRFGRMFRTVPVFNRDEAFLVDLAAGMQESGAGADNPSIPAGYTYLGQFVDHDITFDPLSSLERTNDPAHLVNFRTPRFDLDSLYGSGPADDPFMYDQTSPNGFKLLVGKVHDDDGKVINEDDLPRNAQDRALIGDPRNDENVFVGQLHLAFVKLHNVVIDEVASEGLAGEDLFKETQKRVRWHYQWVVAHDYLKRIIGPTLHAKLLKGTGTTAGETVDLQFYKPKNNAFMPLEFSAAAFRFGHSQVRGGYKINNTVPGLPTFLPDATVDRRADFRGFRGLPPEWTISWPFFFEFKGEGDPQLTRAIDTKLAGPLFGLPGETTPTLKSLALRNLLRGLKLQLPAGQDVAQRIGEIPLTAQQLGFQGPAPLWFYILREAEVLNGGQHLGPVGGTIVGETLLGLLKEDRLSYLNVKPSWIPTLGGGGTDFDLPALLSVAVPNQVTRF